MIDLSASQGIFLISLVLTSWVQCTFMSNDGTMFQNAWCRKTSWLLTSLSFLLPMTGLMWHVMVNTDLLFNSWEISVMSVEIDRREFVGGTVATAILSGVREQAHCAPQNLMLHRNCSGEICITITRPVMQKGH